MNVFDKRPLSLILCIFLSGFIIFSGISTSLSFVLITIILLVGALLLFSPIKRLIKRAGVIAATVALFLSFLLSMLYFNLYFNIYSSYEDKEDIEIVATVSSVKETTYGYSTELSTHRIDGEKVSRRVIAYVEKDIIDELEEYSVITLCGRICDFESSDDFDSRSYYRARGFSAEIVDITSCTVSGEDSGGLDRWLEERRERIAGYITDITGEIGGGLLVALLLGDRDYLSGLTRHAFTRLGATHPLAISGMHLVILMYGINRLLLLLRVKKKTRKVAEIILCIAYTALTGFPVSVVRASIMLIISDILFLLSNKADSFTSLFISVSIICIATPYAIYDVSLWLSAFATLGLLIYVELDERGEIKSYGMLGKIYKLFSPLIISAFAICSTMLLSNLDFGSISVVSAISSPLVTLMTEVYMYLGIITILVGGILGIGEFTELVGELITRLVSYLSSINGIYVAADYAIISLLTIAMTILIILFLLLKLKRKRNYLLVILSLFILTNMLAFTLNAIAASDEVIRYECNGSNEVVYISSEGERALIDVSSASNSATYDVIDSVRGLKLRDVDKFVYTNYSPTLADGALRLCSQIYVDELYIPYPKIERERDLARAIIQAFRYSSTRVVLYDIGETLELGDVIMFPAYRDMVEDKVAFCLIDDEEAITYLSSGMLEDKTRAVALTFIEGCETLILGRHGTRYYGERFISIIPGIKRIILGSLNFTIPQDIIEFYKNTELVYYPETYEIKR